MDRHVQIDKSQTNTTDNEGSASNDQEIDKSQSNTTDNEGSALNDQEIQRTVKQEEPREPPATPTNPLTDINPPCGTENQGSTSNGDETVQGVEEEESTGHPPCGTEDQGSASNGDETVQGVEEEESTGHPRTSTNSAASVSPTSGTDDDDSVQDQLVAHNNSPLHGNVNGQLRNEHYCSCIAGLGGFIVGYMTSLPGCLLGMDDYLRLISKGIFQKKFQADTNKFCAYRNQLLFLISSLIHLMAIPGLLVSSFWIPWERRRVLLWSTILLLLGVTCAASFSRVGVLVPSLILAGFGVGLIHQVTRVIYIHTIHQDARRSIFDWGVIAGGLFAVAMSVFSSYFTFGWRLSYAFAAIPTFILLNLSSFIFEPPNYLIEQNFTALGQIFTRPHRAALFITTFEFIFGSMSGTQLIIFYGPFLIHSIKPTNHLELLGPLIITAVQASGKFVGQLSMRWIGRRMTFVVAYLVATTSLVCLAILFYANPNEYQHLKSRPATISIVMVMLYAFSNGLLLGPYGWIDSRFPKEHIELGFSYGYCLGLFFSFVVNQTLFHLLCKFREWTFILYAIYNLSMMCLLLVFIPETTGMEQHHAVRETLTGHWFWQRYDDTLE